MLLRRIACVVASVVTVVCLTGCVYSDYPLLEEGQVLPVDRELQGVWETETPLSEPAVIRIGLQDDKTYRVSDASDPDKLLALVRIGRIGDVTVADFDIRQRNEAEKGPRYGWTLVESLKPEIRLATMDAKLVRDLAGKYPKELLVKSDESEQLRIDSPRADVQAFVRKHAREMKTGATTVLTRPTTRPVSVQRADGVIQQRLGSYTIRPLTREQAMATLKLQVPLPDDARDVQYSGAQEWQMYEFVYTFKASPASCLRHAKAVLAERDPSGGSDSAAPPELKAIDQKSRKGFIDAMAEPGWGKGGIGLKRYRIEPHWPAKWYAPEKIEKGLEAVDHTNTKRVWVDTERGVFFYEKTD